MAFKTEELMVHVMPGTRLWAQCGSQNCPGGAAEGSGCENDTRCPGGVSGCQGNTQNCPGGSGCQNDTQRVKGGTAGVSGLALLRRQMRERLSQELPY